MQWGVSENDDELKTGRTSSGRVSTSLLKASSSEIGACIVFSMTSIASTLSVCSSPPKPARIALRALSSNDSGSSSCSGSTVEDPLGASPVTSTGLCLDARINPPVLPSSCVTSIVTEPCPSFSSADPGSALPSGR